MSKLTLQERAAKHHENTTKILRPIGIQAAVKHPKAKLWAKVNHEDNFIQAIKSTVHDALVGEIAKFLIPEDLAWFNTMLERPRISSNCGSGTKFDAFVMDICREAYILLRK